MRMIVRSKTELMECLDRMKFEPWHEEMLFVWERAPEKKIRSIRQNRLLHLWMKWLYIECPQMSPTQWKEYYKREYLQSDTVYIRDKPVAIIPSTSSLTTKQFNEFLNAIHQDAMHEVGVLLPYPEDSGYEDFYKTVSERFPV